MISTEFWFTRSLFWVPFFVISSYVYLPLNFKVYLVRSMLSHKSTETVIDYSYKYSSESLLIYQNSKLIMFFKHYLPSIVNKLQYSLIFNFMCMFYCISRTNCYFIIDFIRISSLMSRSLPNFCMWMNIWRNERSNWNKQQNKSCYYILRSRISKIKYVPIYNKIHILAVNSNKSENDLFIAYWRKWQDLNN